MANKNEQVILCVNIGNTVTKLGLFRGKELAATWVVTTPFSTTVSEVQTVLMTFAASLSDEALKKPDDGIVASVVPTVTDKWISALNIECGKQPLVVGPGLKTGIKLGYSDPSEIGADRIADVVAARSKYSCPLIVINMETTTTFEVINDKGEFVGGVIALGLEASVRELSNVAAKIPVIEVKAPATVIAKSTRESVQAGAVMGEVARIDGLVEMMWAELGYKTRVIAAGSHAHLIQTLSKTVDECVDNLTLHGLNLLYMRNRK